MRLLQGSARHLDALIASARDMGMDSVAIPLGTDRASFDRVRESGLEPWAWHSAARDPEAARAHPEWMHAPQHHEWLRRFPEYEGGHPALVAPYIGLGTRLAAEHALRRLARNEQPERLVLLDVQGPPMGCGCGNPSCRSWDNAPGEKVAPGTYEHPDLLFPLEFARAVRALWPETRILPVLCPECERGIDVDGVDDPDGPEGTDLCQGVACVSPCATVFWPRLLTAMRAEWTEIGLLLTVSALEKDHPAFGAPRAWAERAHRHYGTDLLPAIEPEDIARFERCLVLADYDQSVWPERPPEGYIPSVPPIRCGLH